MGEPGQSAAQHMDAIYRYQRYVYDATRKFYLLGRDRLITELAPPAGGSVLEIACGAPLADVLDAAGGASEPLRAVLVGGCHGVWIGDADVATTKIHLHTLRLVGSAVCGSLARCPALRCIKEVAAELPLSAWSRLF